MPNQIASPLRHASDGRALLMALLLTIPAYAGVSWWYGTAASARLRSALAALPQGVADALPDSARAGWSATQLLDPQVDDQIRGVRGQLQRRVDGASGSVPLNPPDAASVGEVLNDPSLSVGFLARALGYEQFISYVLTVWTLLMIARRWVEVREQEVRLEERPIELQPGEIVHPEDCVRLQAELLSFEDPPRGPSALSRSLFNCLRRFETSRDVAAAEAVVRSDSDAVVQDMDSSLSLARYVAWAVPSVGFIGTVRGIGQALSLADSPNNLPAIVGFLAVAFDTTLIALLLSIAIMLAMHLFQKHFEGYAAMLVRRCNDLLVSHLTVSQRTPSWSKSGADAGASPP